MNLDLQKIRYFLEVARQENLTAAAYSLYIAPQALSRHIRAFEDSLGLVLFNSSGTRMALTEDGQRCFLELSAAMLAYDKAMDNILGGQGKTLRLGFQSLLPRRAVIDRLMDEAAAHVRKPTHMVVDDMAPLLRMLHEKQLDFCFLLSPEAKNVPGFDTITLASLPLSVAVPPGHPWQCHTRFVLSDLAGENLVMMDPVVLDTLAGIPLKDTVVTPSYSTLLAYLNMGTYLALAPALFEHLGAYAMIPTPEGISISYRLQCLYRPGAQDGFARRVEQLAADTCFGRG